MTTEELTKEVEAIWSPLTYDVHLGVPWHSERQRRDTIFLIRRFAREELEKLKPKMYPHDDVIDQAIKELS